MLDAYMRWELDHDAHAEKVGALAGSLGLELAAARTWVSFTGTTTLTGFTPPLEMTLWEHHPDHRPVPPGWRIDKKENLLRPSRKTKAERENQINKVFNSLRRIPDIHTYMRGLPTEISIRPHIYGMQYYKGSHCVMAYTGGDPDRCVETRPVIDTEIWHRQKLSDLIALRESASAA